MVPRHWGVPPRFVVWSHSTKLPNTIHHSKVSHFGKVLFLHVDFFLTWIMGLGHDPESCGIGGRTHREIAGDSVGTNMGA